MQGGNAAIMQFRKALGLPENQPAPEAQVIEACMGKLGPDLKRMAEAVGGQAPGAPTNPAENPNANPPTTPDAGQAGNQPAPPATGAQQDQGSTPVQPGASTGGKMPGAATIFGKAPVRAIGNQPGMSDDEEDPNAPMPQSNSIFRRR